MSKAYHCATCGKSINVFRKAIPKRGTVLDLVEPHECNPDEVVDDYQFLPEKKEEKKEDIPSAEKAKLDFSFVSRLNKAPDTDPLVKDKRPKDQQRKELQTSIAPPGILQRAGASSHIPVTTNRDLQEPEDAD